MASHTSLGNLSAEEREQLRDVRARFERALKKDPPPDLARFLPPPDHRIRLPMLCTLIEADMEGQWRRGQPVFIEAYLERFPELVGNRPAVLELIGIEYRIRREHGDDCGLAAYRDRFPGEYPDLQRNITTPSSSDVGPLSPATQVVSQPAPVSRAQSPGMPVAAAGITMPVGGGYQLLERLGSGGFGEVWKAYAPGGVECAMKIIFRPLDHADAQSELEALELVKKLHHPFLLQTHSFYALDDRLLIAMELAEGSLRTRLRECVGAGVSGIPVSELLRHFGEACEAIDFLHARHVLHRDIKPDNILLVAGHVKVCDFGLARTLPSMQSLRVTGMSGTPGYMAPEAWRGRPGPRSDLYALAATYVEVRLNRTLFPGKDYYETMVNHVEREPELDALPVLEREVLLRALAKQPNQRYQNCMEFWEALQLARGPSRPSQPVTAASTPGIDVGDTEQPPTQLDDKATPRVRAGLGQSSPKTQALATSNDTELTGATPTQYRHWTRWAVVLGAIPVLIGVVVAVASLPGPSGSSQAIVSNGNGTNGNGNGEDIAKTRRLPLPSGFEPAKGASIVFAGGREVYDRVVRVTPGGIRVEFILVPQMRPSEEPAFYMMENKVWNQLYAEFAQFAVKQGDPVKTDWMRGAVVKKEETPADQNPSFPVLRVTLDDAHRFAVWLGGELPTARQWDQAGGRFSRPQVLAFGSLICGLLQASAARPFPNLPPFQWKETNFVGSFALDGPLDVGIAKRDISPWGCHDMAGNGYEWTRSIYEDDNKEDQLVNFGDMADVMVSMRSHSYVSAGQPFNFDDPRDARKRHAETSPDVSFRVAIDLEAFLSAIK